MSLARSASGPGGLTINTGAANNASSTPPSQPAPSGGLFGGASSSAATNTAPTATAGTGGGMSLFGGGAQKPATGLFGSSTAANTQSNPAGGTGLFGQAQQNTQQNTGGSGLFGQSTANQNQNQTQQQSTGTGLFGASTQQNQNAGQQQSTGTGLFGQSSQQQPAQPAQQSGGGGLFGGASTQQSKPSLFGQSQSQPQQQPQQNNQQQQVPAVQVNFDNLRPRSRFDDLAQPVQDEIALIDKGISRVIKMKDQIGEFMPQHERDIEQLGRDVKYVESKFRTVQTALNSDIQTVKQLQDLTKKNIGDAQLSFKATDNLKLPTHYHATGLFAGGSSTAAAPSTNGADASSTHADAQDLITYFNRVCDDVERHKKRLDEYRAEIERDMPGVENGLYEAIRTLRDRHARSDAEGGAIADQLGQVLTVLREMGTAIVNQAGMIADTRERLSRLQAGVLDGGYGIGLMA